MTSATEPRTSTRQRILDAALDLFVEEGFAGTTITEVERRVGLTPGTGSFYRHFPSKEALLTAAVEREVARCRAEIVEARATPVVAEDPHEQQVLGLELALQDVRRFDRLMRLALTEAERVPGLRETITTALQGSLETFAGEVAPTTVVTLAALSGYHFSSLMQGRPFLGMPEAAFLEALAALLEAAERPVP